jgi:hypothetical protein
MSMKFIQIFIYRLFIELSFASLFEKKDFSIIQENFIDCSSEMILTTSCFNIIYFFCLLNYEIILFS